MHITSCKMLPFETYMQLSYDEHPKYGLNLRTRGGGFSKDVPHGKTCKV